MQYKKKDSVQFSHLGKNWHIYRADMETLWENMEDDQSAMNAFEEDERLPYWAELWGSSFGLASWLEKNQACIKDTHCMDLGCGLGFTALCGVHLGAYVLACDYEEKAIQLAQFNAVQNAVPLCHDLQSYLKANSPALCLMHMDWRKPSIAPKSMPIIWAADIAYERRFMPEILKFLDYALTDNGIFWIAEPSRSIYRYFIEEVQNFPFSIEKVFTEITPKISENILSAHVNIWELRRK